ncbi:hypothetical protein [Nostoc sp.]
MSQEKQERIKAYLQEHV